MHTGTHAQKGLVALRTTPPRGLVDVVARPAYSYTRTRWRSAKAMNDEASPYEPFDKLPAAKICNVLLLYTYGIPPWPGPCTDYRVFLQP